MNDNEGKRERYVFSPFLSRNCSFSSSLLLLPALFINTNSRGIRIRESLVHFYSSSLIPLQVVFVFSTASYSFSSVPSAFCPLLEENGLRKNGQEEKREKNKMSKKEKLPFKKERIPEHRGHKMTMQVETEVENLNQGVADFFTCKT